jgi:hypothetical protein
MTRFLAGIAALTLTFGAASLSPANAAERHAGITKHQSTELSSQRHWRGGHRHYGYRGHWGPRRYWGPRYGYYGYPYRYGYYGSPYRYRHYYGGPGFAFRFGPIGFGFY